MTSKRNRALWLLTIAATAAVAGGIAAYLTRGGDATGSAPTGIRMPVSNPPVEPTRPDLFEEPVIEEPEDP